MMPYGTDYTCEHGWSIDECTADGCKNNPDTAYLAELDAERDQADEEPSHVDRLRAALLDTAGLDTLPEPQPLIRSVLQVDSLAWLAGRPGSAKTFVALDMAGSVATGTSWQGYRTTQGPVLYVIAEGARGIRPRVRAWEAAAGRKMTGVAFLPVPVNANSDPQWRALCELAAELRPVLVVIDTQARVTLGLEENSSKDMGLFVEQLERLRRSCSACVLVLHHTPRNGDNLRGSTAMEGAATTVVRVVKDGADVTLINDPEEGGKQKDSEPFESIYLRLVTSESSAFLSANDHPQRTDPNAPKAREMLARWWHLHGTDPVSLTALIESTVCPKRTFYNYRKALLNAGLIETEGKGNNVRYWLVKDPNI